MALCMSGELRPPDPLSEELQAHLTEIRRQFREQCPMVDSVSFTPPWEANRVGLHLEDSTAAAILADRYHQWDSLNAALGVVDIQKQLLRHVPVVVLVFRDFLHPHRLGAMYTQLPGIRSVVDGSYFSDAANIYPRVVGTRFSYLFRISSGQWEASSPNERFAYFEVSPDGARLVGTWNGGHNQPLWWSEAKLNWDLYRQW